MKKVDVFYLLNILNKVSILIIFTLIGENLSQEKNDKRKTVIFTKD